MNIFLRKKTALVKNLLFLHTYKSLLLNKKMETLSTTVADIVSHLSHSESLFEVLLLLLVTVWVSGSIFAHMGLPRILGEILAGVFLGPVFLGIDADTETVKFLADLGVFFLMFHAGLDTNPKELYSRWKPSLVVCLSGIFPLFILSTSLLLFFGYSWITSLFMAAVLSLNSIPIIVSVLRKFGLKNKVVGHTVLGASVVNELLLFIGVSVLLSIEKSGQFLFSEFLWIFTKLILFFGGVMILGMLFLPFFRGNINTIGRKGFTFTLIVALVFGLFAEIVGLHIILGAYLAGMFIRQEIKNPQMFTKIEDRFYGLANSFLGPIFFAYVGMTISFEVFWKNPLLFFLLFFIVLFAQTIGSAAGAFVLSKYSKRHALQTGIGMLGRGGTEIIVAGIGFSVGILPLELFSVVVGIVFLATFLMPFLLLFLEKKETEKREEAKK